MSQFSTNAGVSCCSKFNYGQYLLCKYRYFEVIYRKAFYTIDKNDSTFMKAEDTERIISRIHVIIYAGMPFTRH